MKNNLKTVGACVCAVAAFLSLKAERPDASDESTQWISAADAPEADAGRKRAQLSADGTSCFRRVFVNPGEIAGAKWTVTGLGIFEVYVNGRRIGGDDALKPGYTHARKTRYSFSYDVTSALDRSKGARNVLFAEVSSGWWSDKVAVYSGRKNAFRGELELTFADGSRTVIRTRPGEWEAGIGGPVKRAGIFDGEIYDARVAATDVAWKPAVVNTEFSGKILPSAGAETYRRFDLALAPVEAYCWMGVDGATEKAYGTVRRVRTFKPGEPLTVKRGETLVVDFGQNAAAVPRFTEMNAKEGTRLVTLFGEMLNDGNGARSRGNDGPEGSVYRVNLRISRQGMRSEYTFGSARDAEYMPRFTFFGYRYATITATDDASFRIASIPVTSIKKEHESGKLETGHAAVNRLVSNVYWGQLSNYLSVPTDCPQRNERCGWTADTQVFAETGAYNADTYGFMRKWMRDLRDSQHRDGAYPSVAPNTAPYGRNHRRFGWGDAGIIVPYVMWRHFGNDAIIRENWDSMSRYMRMMEGAGDSWGSGGQYADWLSFESCDTKGLDRAAKKAVYGRYNMYLASCYRLWDKMLMAEMASATGRADEAERFLASARTERAAIRKKWFSSPDGMIDAPYRGMQCPALFALRLDIVEGAARAKTVAALKDNFTRRGNLLSTGFLGTSVLMDVLTACGLTDLAYSVLLSRECPGWLYSVDQGATTIWERWNSYVKATGFGAVGMNSFNHYAYGVVLSWMYKTAAGIASDPANPGFKNIIMAPKPDRRLGYVTAEYRSAAGLIKSAWRYEDDVWVWTFTVPEGATADVTLPGETASKRYGAGTHTIRR